MRWQEQIEALLPPEDVSSTASVRCSGRLTGQGCAGRGATGSVQALVLDHIDWLGATGPERVALCTRGAWHAGFRIGQRVQIEGAWMAPDDLPRRWHSIVVVRAARRID